MRRGLWSLDGFSGNLLKNKPSFRSSGKVEPATERKPNDVNTYAEDNSSMPHTRSTRVELEEKCIENCQKNGCHKKLFTEFLVKRFPICAWLPRYNLTALQFDIIAGVTVGLMVVPQGLAYALIAGLPPQYGLYSAFMGCFIYCIFGTSKDITIGPTAIMSLVVSVYGRADIPAFVVILTLFSGLIQLVMGILKLGFVVNFISIPVVSGFTSSAAIIIAIGQIKDLLGLRDVPRPFLKRVYYTFKHLGDTRTGDLILGVVCIVILLVLRKLGRTKWVKENQEAQKWKWALKKCIWLITITRNALIILLASCVVIIFFERGFGDAFSLTGHLDPGLPPIQPPSLTITTGNRTLTPTEVLSDIGPGLFIVPLIGFLESIAIAKAFARKHKYRVDASQELIALGLANVFGSFVSSYPVTGSFSRTAVNAQSGVASPAGGIFTGAVVLLALGVLTPFFKYIPKASLAALIISSVLTMVEYRIVMKIWKVKKIDLLPLFVTFFGCFYEIEYGILGGIAVSLIIFLYPVVWPKLIKADQDFTVIKVNGDLVYAGMEHVTSKVQEVSFLDPSPRGIVIDMSVVTQIDFTVTQSLLILIDDFEHRKIPLFFSGVQDQIRDIMAESGIDLKIINPCPEMMASINNEEASPFLNDDIERQESH